MNQKPSKDNELILCWYLLLSLEFDLNCGFYTQGDSFKETYSFCMIGCKLVTTMD